MWQAIEQFLGTYGVWIAFMLVFPLLVLLTGMRGRRGDAGRDGDTSPGHADRHRTPAAGDGGDGVPSRRPLPGWALIAFSLAFWLGASVLMGQPQSTATHDEVPLSQVAADVRAGQVRKIAVEGDALTITRNDGTEQHSRKEPLVSLGGSLSELGVSRRRLRPWRSM